MGLMKNCKETSLLVTQSFDRRLKLSERIGMRIHLAVCENCSRFMRQMQLMREWMGSADETSQPGLKDESRERIARNLREGE